MKILIPSKTFLWGEYSSLIGGSAGILTSDPCFELLVDFLGDKPTEKKFKFTNNKSYPDFCILKEPSKNDLKTYFHPDSPAGLFLKDFIFDSNPIQELSFFDPHNLKGGFGRSTAEYIVTAILKEHFIQSSGLEASTDHQAIIKDIFSKDGFSKKLWKSYKNILSMNSITPSGYDLLAQAYNLNFDFSIDSKDTSKVVLPRLSIINIQNEFPNVQNINWDINLNILLFKTNLKVKTHEHLISVTTKDLENLKYLSQNVSDSFESKNSNEFVMCLKKFDVALTNLKYKNLEILKVCENAKEITDCVYARGCGALGADVIAVFYRGNKSEELILKMQALADLIFIADIHGID